MLRSRDIRLCAQFATFAVYFLREKERGLQPVEYAPGWYYMRFTCGSKGDNFPISQDVGSTTSQLLRCVEN